MTSSDVMGLGTKCWRAQTSQSGNISASTGARAVSSISNMTVLEETKSREYRWDSLASSLVTSKAQWRRL